MAGHRFCNDRCFFGPRGPHGFQGQRHDHGRLQPQLARGLGQLRPKLAGCRRRGRTGHAGVDQPLGDGAGAGRAGAGGGCCCVVMVVVALLVVKETNKVRPKKHLEDTA